MLRLPAVAGRFYPSDADGTDRAGPPNTPKESNAVARRGLKACLVPHAGYMYSGHVAGAVLRANCAAQENSDSWCAALSAGLDRWRLFRAGRGARRWATRRLTRRWLWRLRAACPLLREDSVAHSEEHSLEVQIPFLADSAAGIQVCAHRAGNDTV